MTGAPADSTTNAAKAALLRAIRHCGGQAELARQLTGALGRTVSQQWVWAVVNRGQPVPAEWCLAIETATARACSRHDLRPDLYPPPQSEGA